MSVESASITTSITDSEIICTLRKLRDVILELSKLPGSNMNEFVQVAAALGNILPKLPEDSRLFEIDDILYQDEDINAGDTQDVTLDILKGLLSSEVFELYIQIYSMLTFSDLTPTSRILETTYLQMIINSPDKVLKDEYIHGVILFSLEHVMDTRNKHRLCFSLKVLKIVLSRNRAKIIETLQKDYTFLFIWMFKLPNIPEPRHPQQKRISAWLKYHSIDIIDTINPCSFEYKQFPKYVDLISSPDKQKFDVNYVNILAKARYVYPLIFERFHSYFMSANDEEEKIRRLKDFLVGFSHSDLSKVQMYEDGEYKIQYSTSMVISCLPNFVHGFVAFGKILKNRVYSDDTLRDLENRYGCEIKPYLLKKENITQQDVSEEPKDEFEDELNNSLNNKNDDADEPDYTIEHYLFYEDFVKDLQVLSVVHTAAEMCQELLKTKGEFVGDDSKLFRGDFPVMNYLRKAILNPSECCAVPWLIDLLARKCPFLLLPKRHEHLIGDLLKMLKGEEIDDWTKEDICFALNSVVSRY